MSKLSKSARGKLPKSAFALSGGRFPINDANHARAAISGATRAERAGNITPEEETFIKRKAKNKLGLLD